MELESIFEIAPGFRLQWEKIQDCYVLLYPEGMIQLNPSAGEILLLLDGKKNVSSMIAELKKKFNEESDITEDITELLKDMKDYGWIKPRD